MSAPASPPTLACNHDKRGWTLTLGGHWCFGVALPEIPKTPFIGGGSIRLQAEGLSAEGSILPAFLHEIRQRAEAAGLGWDDSALPGQYRRLIALASAGGGRSRGEHAEHEPDRSFSERVGLKVLDGYAQARRIFDFVGQALLALQRWLRGRSHLRKVDFMIVLQEATTGALPIVTLISFLVGLIIAFLGAVVLERFGAEFAVSYLVGYGMLREMGALMTAVIMAGRTGAAYAAQLGTMKVNEEIDALETFGIPAMDHLVLPRLLALGLAMPLLTIYANIIGIFAGFLVATGMMEVPPNVFFREMNLVVGVPDLLLGLFKGGVFGVLVGFTGCRCGLQAGNSAGAVGQAATRAVVTGITLIVAANAIIDWAAAVLNL